MLAPGEDQPHLIEALDGVARRLGGLTQRWRFDRMATVCHPDSGRLTATFGPVAAFYQVGVDICPARRGNRKGVVEKANHTAAQRWWRTLANEVSPAWAQTDLDRFCVRVGDARPRRRGDGTATTVAGLAAGEALRPMPTAPFPAVLSADAQISAQALVCFRGNSYSVGPGMAGTTVTVVHRLGTATLDIVSAGGVVLARHRRLPDSAGAVIRHDEHVTALEHAVLVPLMEPHPNFSSAVSARQRAANTMNDVTGAVRLLARSGSQPNSPPSPGRPVLAPRASVAGQRLRVGPLIVALRQFASDRASRTVELIPETPTELVHTVQCAHKLPRFDDSTENLRRRLRILDLSCNLPGPLQFVNSRSELFETGQRLRLLHKNRDQQRHEIALHGETLSVGKNREGGRGVITGVKVHGGDTTKGVAFTLRVVE